MKNIYVIGKEILNIFPFCSHIMHLMTDEAHEGLKYLLSQVCNICGYIFYVIRKVKESLNFSLWFLIGTLQHIQKLIVKTLLHYECIFYNLITTNQMNTLVSFYAFEEFVSVYIWVGCKLPIDQNFCILIHEGSN